MNFVDLGSYNEIQRKLLVDVLEYPKKLLYPLQKLEYGKMLHFGDPDGFETAISLHYSVVNNEILSILIFYSYNAMSDT